MLESSVVSCSHLPDYRKTNNFLESSKVSRKREPQFYHEPETLDESRSQIVDRMTTRTCHRILPTPEAWFCDIESDHCISAKNSVNYSKVDENDFEECKSSITSEQVSFPRDGSEFRTMRSEVSNFKLSSQVISASKSASRAHIAIGDADQENEIEDDSNANCSSRCLGSSLNVSEKIGDADQENEIEDYSCASRCQGSSLNVSENLSNHNNHNNNDVFCTMSCSESISTYHDMPHRQLSKVGSPSAAPSWTELSTEVVPAAALELLSSSLHQIYHTARLTYYRTKWTERYSEYGNNATGFFPQNQVARLLRSESDLKSNNEFSQIWQRGNYENLPRFSSLSWTDRQMVKEWRTYYPVDSALHRENRNDQTDDEPLENHDLDNVDFDSARTLFPAPLPRPVWQNADVCFVCHKTFGPTLLRHHCRLCGCSVCHKDSRQKRKLPQFECYHPDVPERVCDSCGSYLWEQNLTERISWRLTRCRDYRNNTLSPYFESGVDSVEQKAYRIAQAAITMAKSIPLGAQATIAVETVDVLRKYGLSGIYTIMLRQEFLAAADLLRQALGINQTAWPLSVHELSAAIFYALAQHRAMRGINPSHEHTMHSFRNETVDARTDSTQPHFSFGSVSHPVPDSVVSSLIFYAPLALNFIYIEKEVDMQLLAAQQGWRLVYAYLNSERDGGYVEYLSSYANRRYANPHDRPASALFVHEESKIACISIRGTTTINDVITDIRQIPVPFPDAAIESLRSEVEGEDSWIDVSSTFRGKGVAVSGMANAAFNLYREHIDSLLVFARDGYRIRLCGHSLGGAVAALLGVLVAQDLKKIFDISPCLGEGMLDSELCAPLRVYAYGTPSCVDAKLAEVVDSFVITAVLHDDVVPRLSPTSCRALLKHLLHIRETWVKTQFPDDIKAFAERAKGIWAPRWRGGFVLRSPGNTSIKFKRYCRSKLLNGKKNLISVKDKLLGLEQARSSGQFVSVTHSHTHSVERSLDSENKHANGEKESMEVAADERSLTDECAKLRLVMDIMGNSDSLSDGKGLIVDGEEFFDPESLLIESSDEEDDSVTSLRDGAVSSPTSSSHDVCHFVNENREINNRNANSTPDENEDAMEPVVLEEVPLPRMYPPGKIVHVYSHYGVYKSAFVPKSFREIRRISMAGNMLSDHKTQSYYDALLEVRSVRMAPENPPIWTGFAEDDKCSCCASRFTWASTSDSEAQEARDKHNCRSCGALVCHPCSKNLAPLPSIGLTVPVRVCDRCHYNSPDVDLLSSSSLQDTKCTSAQDDQSKPIRFRAKRSAIVDDLASRLLLSSLQES